MKEGLNYCQVEAIEPIGEGTRVCVDFADLLDPEEGVLVGDSGHGYFLVLSENQPSATYPARPFRVNCGGVHHYLLREGEATNYLSELKPETSVSVLHGRNETTRPVPIGRIKMEKRPLLRVIARHRGQRISATLQSADSVRLYREAGGAVDLTSLKVGDSILFVADIPGRHLGQRVEEFIQEH